MLLPSHVNSTFGTLKLLDETDCIVFLHSKDVFVDEIAAGRELEILQVPELEELLESGDVELFPYDKTFEEAKNDPVSFSIQVQVYMLTFNVEGSRKCTNTNS